MQFKCDCLHQQSGRKRIIRVKNAVEGGAKKVKQEKCERKFRGGIKVELRVLNYFLMVAREENITRQLPFFM